VHRYCPDYIENLQISNTEIILGEALISRSHQAPSSLKTPMNSTNAQAFKEAPEIPWARGTKGTPVVLMSLMMLGAIEGSTNAKTDRHW
jgi:hypothetical protein